MGLGFWNSRPPAGSCPGLWPSVSHHAPTRACACFGAFFASKFRSFFWSYATITHAKLFLVFFQCIFGPQKVSSARACGRFVRFSLKKCRNPHRYARMHAQRRNPHRLARRLFAAPKPSQGRTEAFSNAKTPTGSHGAISACEGPED